MLCYYYWSTTFREQATKRCKCPFWMPSRHTTCLGKQANRTCSTCIFSYRRSSAGVCRVMAPLRLNLDECRPCCLISCLLCLSRGTCNVHWFTLSGVALSCHASFATGQPSSPVAWLYRSLSLVPWDSNDSIPAPIGWSDSIISLEACVLLRVVLSSRVNPLIPTCTCMESALRH